MKVMRYGELQRDARAKAKKTMGELGRHLGCSVTYISDVELGRRPPPAAERICATAEFLGSKPDEMLAAAARTRGAIELQTRKATPKQLQVGAGLMRRWADLSEEDLEAIERVLERGESKE